MISNVRLTFAADLPFFLSRLSDQQAHYTSNPNFSIVRSSQAEVAANVTGVYLIDTDGPAFGVNADKIHFNATGQLSLGAAFAERMKEILNLESIRSSSDPGPVPR